MGRTPTLLVGPTYKCTLPKILFSLLLAFEEFLINMKQISEKFISGSTLLAGLKAQKKPHRSVKMLRKKFRTSFVHFAKRRN